MEYFKLDLINNSLNFSLPKEERERYDQMWEHQCSLYSSELKKVEKKLQRELVSVLHNGFFHDAIITQISFIKRRIRKKKFFDLKIEMEWRENTIELIHNKVSLFNTSIDLSAGYTEFADYLYGEIFYEDGNWVHNFLLLNDDEINIKCEKIIYNKI